MSINCYSPNLVTYTKKSLAKLGEKNPNWSGNNVGYGALHEWVGRRLPKPEKCVLCNKGEALDLCNISGKYRRDLTDWQWLCRRCHMKIDGRMGILKKTALVIGHTNYKGRIRDPYGRFI